MNSFLANYLGELIPVAFRLKTEEGTQLIGKGEPEFTVTLKKDISKKDLMTSTSLALGEAYMRGDLELDRDLYEVLDLFLGQMSKFHTDTSALKKADSDFQKQEKSESGSSFPL